MDEYIGCLLWIQSVRFPRYRDNDEYTTPNIFCERMMPAIIPYVITKCRVREKFLLACKNSDIKNFYFDKIMIVVDAYIIDHIIFSGVLDTNVFLPFVMKMVKSADLHIYISQPLEERETYFNVNLDNFDRGVSTHRKRCVSRCEAKTMWKKLLKCKMLQMVNGKLRVRRAAGSELAEIS